jgi:hypothetical protein
MSTETKPENAKSEELSDEIREDLLAAFKHNARCAASTGYNSNHNYGLATAQLAEALIKLEKLRLGIK